MKIDQFLEIAGPLEGKRGQLAVRAVYVMSDMIKAGFTEFTIYGSFLNFDKVPNDIDLLVSPALRADFTSGRIVRRLRAVYSPSVPSRLWNWSIPVIGKDGRKMSKLEAEWGVDAIFDFGIIPNSGGMTYKQRCQYDYDGVPQGVIEIQP
jgi:hypothetical protein